VVAAVKVVEEEEEVEERRVKRSWKRTSISISMRKMWKSCAHG